MSENQMKGANLYSCTGELQTGNSQIFINFSYSQAGLTAEFRWCSGERCGEESILCRSLGAAQAEPWEWLEPQERGCELALTVHSKGHRGCGTARDVAGAEGSGGRGRLWHS